MKFILSLSLVISAMASHSPFRQIQNEERNLVATLPVVSLLYDPLYVNTDAADYGEASNVDAIIQDKGLTTNPVSTLAAFLDGVSSAQALMIPELENSPINPTDLTSTRIQALQDFVDSGRALVLTIDSSDYVEQFLMTVFGFTGLENLFPYSGYWSGGPAKLQQTDDRASTVWSGLVHTEVTDLDGVWQHDVSFFPAGTLTAYGGSIDGYGSVLQIPYQDGWIYLIGFDFYSAPNVDCECWKDVLVAPFLAPQSVTAAAASAVTAKCQNPLNVFVNGNCQATVEPAAVDDGSSSTNGEITSWAFLQGASPFELGTTSVTLEVADDAGGVGTCQAEVTAIDNIAPEVQCNAPSTVQYGTQNCFKATKTDNCDTCETDTIEIMSYTCKKQNARGRWVDITGTKQCRIAVVGDRICVRRIGTTVKLDWVVAATDCSGNLGSEACGTLITKA